MICSSISYLPPREVVPPLLSDVRLLLRETELLELVERLDDTVGRDWERDVDCTVVARLLLPAFVLDDALTVLLLDVDGDVRLVRLCTALLLRCVRALGVA